MYNSNLAHCPVVILELSLHASPNSDLSCALLQFQANRELGAAEAAVHIISQDLICQAETHTDHTHWPHC